MNIVHTAEKAFEETFRRIIRRGAGVEGTIRASVQAIVEDVAARGDSALLDYTEKFDQSGLADGGMEVSETRRLKALEDENRKLKKLLAESMLDVATLLEALGKNF